ncbi:hypothetical protein [Methylorubrum extorquens]|uniref:hypothetical protein n=2 Tax=Methylorubrum extorquens TaxID=408 RepID=UPI00015903CB|nr:hypothetical protein [Methylorubrum extorquens]
MPGVSATLEAAAIDRHADRIGDSEVLHKARAAPPYSEAKGSVIGRLARHAQARGGSGRAMPPSVASHLRSGTLLVRVSGAPRAELIPLAKVVMRVLHSIGRACGNGLRFSVGGLIAALDGLTLLVGRASDRFDAHWAQRTPQLRSRRRQDGPRPLDLPFLHL